MKYYADVIQFVLLKFWCLIDVVYYSAFVIKLVTMVTRWSTADVHGRVHYLKLLSKHHLQEGCFGGLILADKHDLNS